MLQEISNGDATLESEDCLSNEQRTFRDKIAEFGNEGVNSDEFNKLLKLSDLTNKSWKEMVDWEIFTFKRLIEEDRCMVKGLLNSTYAN